MRHLQFNDSSGAIEVIYKSSLVDENNLDENFKILNIRGIDSHRVIDKFYIFPQGTLWTLNEFIFFAICNDYCLSIYDSDWGIVSYYGNCSSMIIEDFDDDDFNNDF